MPGGGGDDAAEGGDGDGGRGGGPESLLRPAERLQPPRAGFPSGTCLPLSGVGDDEGCARAAGVAAQRLLLCTFCLSLLLP